MIKQDYDFEKQEDEDLRCPICNYYFSQVTKPYLLPCNHNLCFQCIELITQKNMFDCPLCRKPFNKDGKNNFKVNISLLNLIVKILKTKMIYCTKCSKIFQWTEHYNVCPESGFKETDEILGEIQQLVNSCIQLVKKIDYLEKLKENKSNEIINKILSNQIEIEKKFTLQSQKTIDDFYKSIPELNIKESDFNLILNFVNSCEPIASVLNINLNPGESSNIYGNEGGGGNNMYKISTEEGNELIRKCVEGNNKNNFNSSMMSNNTNNPNQSNYISMNSINNKKNNLDDSEISLQQKYSGQKSLSLLNSVKGTELFDKINYVISIYKNVLDVIQRLVNYIRQVEFTTETIKSQINKNYNKYNKKIFNDLNNVYATIAPDMDKFYEKFKKSSSSDLNYSSDSIKSNNSKENISSSNNINILNENSNIINDENINNKNDKKKIVKSYFCFIIKETKKMMLYNVIDKKNEFKEFDFLEFKLNGTMSVQYKESQKKIFLSGGIYFQESLFSRNKIFSDSLYIIPFHIEPQIKGNDNFTKIKMPRMRYNHTSLIIGEKIYFIGGKDTKGNYIIECDCYNFKDKIWELLPKLNYGREFPSVFCYHKKFIYVFRSLEKETNSHVEILDINDLNEGWRKIQIQDPINSFVPAIKSGISQFDDNTLIICGGYLYNTEPEGGSIINWNNFIATPDGSNNNNKKDIQNKRKEIVDYCYLYNIVTNTIYRTKDLEKSACFTYNGVNLEESGKIIFMDEKNFAKKPFGIHIFDLNTKKWSFC